MTKARAAFGYSVMIALFSVGILLTSCSDKPKSGMIIISRSAADNSSLTKDTTDSWRYVSKAQIVMIDPAKPENVNIVTSDFYSSVGPHISYDGQNMLFSGQKKENDSWQIYEMNLTSLKSKQITSSKENCIDPDYLPGDRIIFSQYSANDPLKSGHSLYTCKTDGSDLQRITFNPATFVASKVLSDGRVLTLERQIYPEQGYPMYMALRPDGTKLELFYKSQEGYGIVSPICEDNNGKLLFIEAQHSNSAGRLISISYNRPMHSKVDLSSGLSGDFKSVSSVHSGNLMVSYRKSESEKYSLYEYNAENKLIGKQIYADNSYDVIEAVYVSPYTRPKKLPSEVDMGVKSGLIMCQDVNILSGIPEGYGNTVTAAIQIVGIDSVLGRVDVAEDGSFYLKVIADTPFRIQTIDKDGRIQNDICNWISLRPNERRGCVGCHEDPEYAPGNKVPQAVKLSPVNIPVHINKVVEKKVSLE